MVRHDTGVGGGGGPLNVRDAGPGGMAAQRIASPVQLGFQVLAQEAQALAQLTESMRQEDAELAGSFTECVERILSCRGRIVVTGIGKAGIIGQKLAATLASTGTAAHFLHAAEAVHGDLGRFAAGDLAIVLSFSGETDEVIRLLPHLKQEGIPVIAITSRRESSLGRGSVVTLPLGILSEACALGLAPSTSTTCMLALGDALALTVSQMRGFRADDFARFHPGGSLGRKLTGVRDVMRNCHACRMAKPDERLRDALVRESRPGRRSGAVLVVDDRGKLCGLFTDSDLARLLERQCERFLDAPLSDVMTVSPFTVHQSSRLEQAVLQMVRQKISELPVVDDELRPVGMLDITDLVGLFPIDSTSIEDSVPPTTTAQGTDSEAVHVLPLPERNIVRVPSIPPRKHAS